MKYMLGIFFGDFKCVRKFIGGRWVSDGSNRAYSWVQWNDRDDSPLWNHMPEGFIKEEYQ